MMQKDTMKTGLEEVDFKKKSEAATCRHQHMGGEKHSR